MAEANLFDETFTITSVNSEKYDRVSRIYGTSASDSSISMTLDINHDLFPVSASDNLNMVLASTLTPGGDKESEKGKEITWREVQKGEPSLADLFEYVCHGKVYRFEDGDGNAEMCKFYASFGGLLLFVEGPVKKMSGMHIENIYLLIKKT